MAWDSDREWINDQVEYRAKECRNATVEVARSIRGVKSAVDGVVYGSGGIEFTDALDRLFESLIEQREADHDYFEARLSQVALGWVPE